MVINTNTKPVDNSNPHAVDKTVDNSINSHALDTEPAPAGMSPGV